MKRSTKMMKLSPLQRQEHAIDQLLDERAELLIGLQLLRAGILTRMRSDTPDFECRDKGCEFGVEVTTRSCTEVALALHRFLERGPRDGPEVGVILMRSEKRLTAMLVPGVDYHAGSAGDLPSLW